MAGGRDQDHAGLDSDRQSAAPTEPPDTNPAAPDLGADVLPSDSPSRSPEPRTRVVALTGAASFLGRNLIGLLEEDDRVERIVSVDVEPPATARDKTLHAEVDLAGPDAETRMHEVFRAERVDTLVHLSFLSSPTHATDLAHEIESVGTMHALNACRRAGVNKLVMRSHTLLYGAHPTNPNFLTEGHPLRARRREPFFADKIQAEVDAARFGAAGQGRIVTVLRTAPILGPTANNTVTRYLSHRAVPTVMGFDPLWQFVHEADAVAAFKLAVDRDSPGVFNIVGGGVLPLSTVIKLAGRMALPLPRPLAEAAVRALWMAQLAEAPADFLDYLQYLCVADGARALQVMGFAPAYTSREALVDYANAQHLRDAKLLSETETTE